MRNLSGIILVDFVDMDCEPHRQQVMQMMREALAADRVIVMAEGRLIAQGTPREVFSRGRELRANGLDLPPIAMLRDKLIDGGMDIPADVITAEELAEAICPLK